MHDELAVALGAEYMAASAKLGLALGIVEQLAVADDDDVAVLVEDRLLAVCDADNAEAAIAKADTRCDQRADIVWPAMHKRRCHALHLRTVRLPPAAKIDHTCQ